MIEAGQDRRLKKPRLRFTEFQCEWSRKKLANVTSKIQDGTHFSPQIVDGGECLYITSKNIRMGFLDLSSVAHISRAAHEEIYKRCNVKRGDVLLTKDGAGTGNVCLNTIDEEFSLLSSVAFIRGDRVNSESGFVYFALLSPRGQKNIQTSISGQAITRITLEKLRGYDLYYPSIAEQAKITSFLNAMDERILGLSKKRQLLKVYRKGVLQKLFRQTIRFKRDDGSSFPDWQKVKLGDCLEVHQERVSALTDIPVYTSSRRGLFPQSETRTIKNEGELGVVPHGYMTYRHMSDDATFKFNINQTGHKIAVSKEYPVFRGKGVCTRFLQKYFNESDDFKRFAIAQKLGGTRTRLYFKNLAAWEPRLPLQEEQEKIADFLAAIENKIHAVEDQLEAAQAFKAGLLQQMFV